MYPYTAGVVESGAGGQRYVIGAVRPFSPQPAIVHLAQGFGQRLRDASIHITNIAQLLLHHFEG